MSRIPDRLNIDKNDRNLYEKIEMDDFFKGKTRKEQFLLAMAIGFRNNIKRPLSTKDGFFLTKDLKAEDSALIMSIALSNTDNVDILADKEEIFRIAEEYAHAGIKLLNDKIESTSFGNFWKHFEKDLHELYDE